MSTDRTCCCLCCRCLCTAAAMGCLWLFIMDCKPRCRRTELPREPHPHIPPGDAPVLHGARTLRSASLSFSPLVSLVCTPPSSNSISLHLLNAAPLQPEQQSRYCSFGCKQMYHTPHLPKILPAEPLFLLMWIFYFTLLQSLDYNSKALTSPASHHCSSFS